MATLTISQHLGSVLDQAAKDAGTTPEQLAESILADYLEGPETPLTAEQIALLKERVEAADRGEFVSQEKVERFLDEWQAELDARVALEAE